MALTQSSTRRSRRTPNRLELPFILLNPIMCRLLSSPLGRGLSGRLMVLTFQGRRSGRSFSLPVSYVVADGGLLVPGGGFWKRNFEGGREAQASLRGKRVSLYGSLIREPAEVESALVTMQRVNPAGVLDLR